MTFVIGRGVAELQILEKKSEYDPISWTEWNIVMKMCIHIDIDKV